MKTFLSFCAAVLFILFFFTSQTITSCTKEKIIRDTVTVNHYDTTIIYLHDTTQLTLEACCNKNEGYVNSYVDYAHSNHNGVIQFTIGAGTHFGNPETARSFIKFDYKDIPSTAVIISAKLSLYAIPNPGSGDLVHAHSGPANSFSIRRITSALNMAQINWGNQPTFTTQNQVIVPQSTSFFQDNTDMDVTNLVKDMMVNGNNGFFMQLQNEATYNFRQYCSSYYTDYTKRPKLVLQYKKE
jgi:hypothetical protein